MITTNDHCKKQQSPIRWFQTDQINIALLNNSSYVNFNTTKREKCTNQ